MSKMNLNTLKKSLMLYALVKNENIPKEDDGTKSQTKKKHPKTKTTFDKITDLFAHKIFTQTKEDHVEERFNPRLITPLPFKSILSKVTLFLCLLGFTEDDDALMTFLDKNNKPYADYFANQGLELLFDKKPVFTAYFKKLLKLTDLDTTSIPLIDFDHEVYNDRIQNYISSTNINYLKRFKEHALPYTRKVRHAKIDKKREKEKTKMQSKKGGKRTRRRSKML
jgi:hypothetical protein